MAERVIPLDISTQDRGKTFEPLDVVDQITAPARGRIQRGKDYAKAGVATAFASLPLGAVDSSLAIGGVVLGVAIGLAGAAQADMSYIDQMEFPKPPTAEVTLTEGVQTEIS